MQENSKPKVKYDDISSGFFSRVLSYLVWQEAGFKALKARSEDGDGNVGKTITLTTHDKKNT